MKDDIKDRWLFNFRWHFFWNSEDGNKILNDITLHSLFGKA
jgi:hypothetical protein